MAAFVFIALKFPVDFSDKKPLGSTGEYVPAIGIGTWNIRSRSSAVEALGRAVELGLNMVDTAEMYQSGRAEEDVGAAIKRVGRDRIFITTKLLPEKFSDGQAAGRAAEASLRRLGVSCADLILIHWPASGIPVETQIKSLEVLVERGLTRYIGVSNFEGRILQRALSSVKRHQLVVNQVKYSVLDREVEDDTLPLCIDSKVTIQAYTPLESGAVLGNKTLADIGRRHGKTAVQTALNYLIARPWVTAIPKTERRESVEEFWGSLGWRLSEKDLEFLEAL